MKKIALFASGSGSNVENIYNHFSNNENVEISLVLTNNPSAFVLKRTEKLGIDAHVFTRDSFYQSDEISQLLLDRSIDLIVLAGFLWLIPPHLVAAFPNKIINIHPALLPKFGGKGMYGSHVHEAVVANQESETGITIHYVNEKYDDGAIIFQAKTPVSKTDTPDTVANNIHQLEYLHFPLIIEQLLSEE